jgi:hypothetical protein
MVKYKKCGEILKDVEEIVKGGLLVFKLND